MKSSSIRRLGKYFTKDEDRNVKTDKFTSMKINYKNKH